MDSLTDRLARRREQLQQERSFVLPVLGYEDVGLFARYTALPYEELRKIGKSNAGLEGTAEGELAVAADTLSRACVELLERREDGSYRGLGHRWTPVAVRELFGLDLPEGSQVRDALHAVFPSTQLMLHFTAYDGELQRVEPAVDEAVAGESEAAPEAALLS